MQERMLNRCRMVNHGSARTCGWRPYCTVQAGAHLRMHHAGAWRGAPRAYGTPVGVASRHRSPPPPPHARAQTRGAERTPHNTQAASTIHHENLPNPSHRGPRAGVKRVRLVERKTYLLTYLLSFSVLADPKMAISATTDLHDEDGVGVPRRGSTRGAA